MREKKKKRKKLTWSLINAPLCSCMYIKGEERKKQQGKEKKNSLESNSCSFMYMYFQSEERKNKKEKEKKTHRSPINAPLCIRI
jgi:hypothetical protein